MRTTTKKYSPSVNIIRDLDSSFEYVSTRNGEQSFSTIISNIKGGQRSYIVIGAYGTGKSSFLLALEQTLSKKVSHFHDSNRQIKQLPKFEFLNIVGEFSSLIEVFQHVLSIGKRTSPNDIISELEKKRNSFAKKGLGFGIIIDEFGKFLEHAAKKSPESELYFIQQLAEWINNPDNDCLFITTLHQDFSAYALHLSRSQRLEWDKVKGRLRELPFNEPVEQLLILASKRLKMKFEKYPVDRNFDKLFKLIEHSKAFPFRNNIDKELAKDLMPFDGLSAAVMTLALQKYGQNERSLFSFIESNDAFGIEGFSQYSSGYYSLSSVYDYLYTNYYNYINSKYNPHFSQWSSVQHAIEKIDGLFENSELQKSAESILKAIGLLGIFAGASGKLEPSFYVKYSQLAMNIEPAEEVIQTLEKRRLIRYVKHSCKYALVEGTDVDIELAIDDAGQIVEKVSSVVVYLSQLFEFPFISAKEHGYKTGTPRYFQFRLTESPIQSIPEGEIDGFINLIFSDSENAEWEVSESSRNCKEAILHGYFRNTAEIKKYIFEIQKIKKAKELNQEDKFAVRELDSIQVHYVNMLNRLVYDNIYSSSESVVWYFKGTKVSISNRQEFNKRLSLICDTIYHSTPVFKNEMVNRTKISSQISSARRKFVERLIEKIDQPNLGFLESEFPPEKSIYLSLLSKTGIHVVKKSTGMLGKPVDQTYLPLWEIGLHFLSTTRLKERKLTELIEIFSQRPFKLKDGFIEFWVPVFLIATSHEYALYESQVYVPEINTDVLELMAKRPNLFTIKAFDVTGVKLDLFQKYRSFLNQGVTKNISSSTFIETIKPFLTFYRGLPEFTKKTNTWLTADSIAIRGVIAAAKDPEKVFFEDFPAALGYSQQDFVEYPEKVGEFISRLKASIKDLQGCFDRFVDHFESYLAGDLFEFEVEFPKYRDRIISRYQGLKTHLLQHSHKTFSSRLFSQLDDKHAWLGSIAQSLVGKSLVNITDSEIDTLYLKLREIFHELDNFNEISENYNSEEFEDVIKLEISSIRKGNGKNVFSIPHSKAKKLNKKAEKIKEFLDEEKYDNMIILAKLLQDIIGDGK
jgi:hypothetical protein